MSVKFLVEESKRLLKQAQDECPHNVITRTVYYHVNEVCEECGVTGKDIRKKVAVEPPKSEAVTEKKAKKGWGLM